MMKKIVLFFALILSVMLMSFSVETSENNKEGSLISMKVEVENLQNEDYPCRWRYCKYRNGVRISCTEWEYGECLEEVVIQAN